MTESKSESGFLTIEAIGALIILAILIPVLGGFWQEGMNAVRKKAVAEHFLTVERAARLYGKQHHAALLGQVTQNSGPSITLEDLKSARCLPERFGETNAWGQGYLITAREDDTGGLAMLVLTTDGRGHSSETPEFANVLVPEAAALAGAGFIPTGLVSSGGVIRGAYGGWEVSLNSIGLAAEPGHLASISTFSSDELGQDFLYRVAVPDHPELNAMQTALDMTNHNIGNIQELGFVAKEFETEFCDGVDDEGRTFLNTDDGLYLCRDGRAVLLTDTGNSLMMRESTVASNGQLIDKPACPESIELQPEIFVAPSLASSGAESPVMASFQAWATNYSDAQWQVNLRVLNAKNEWVYPEPRYGRMLVMTSCAKSADQGGN